MNLETLLSFHWGAMAPEFIILGVATLLSIMDLFMAKPTNRKPLAYIGILGIIAAIFALVGQLDDQPVTILAQTYRLDGFSKAFKLIFLVGALFVMLMSLNYHEHDELENRGEFYYLMLTALLGAMTVASSADMITLFVGLELMSLSSYILAGMRKKNLASNEAAMKYVINGGIASAIMLFGMSYIFGLTGSTNLFVIAEGLRTPLAVENSFLLMIAFFMVFVGLSFKISTVPFHMWAPDVYEGAPTPITAFLSVVSKTAGFALMLRIVYTLFIIAPGKEVNGNIELLLYTTKTTLLVVAALTMIIGNTVALKQTSIKRLFAYSSIAHAGYLLVPILAFTPYLPGVAMNELAFSNIWFYLVGYLFMNLGAFAIIQYVTEKNGSEKISSFAGLGRTSPVAAFMMTIFLLSLAGIPGTVGFMGKLWIIIGALTAKQYVIASIMIATTVVSYFYYFNLLVQMYFRAPQSSSKFSLPVATSIVVLLCAIGTIGLGIFPSAGLEFFQHIFSLRDFLMQ